MKRPHPEEVRQALGRIVRRGDEPATSSAGSVRSSRRRRAEGRAGHQRYDREVIALTGSELRRNGTSLQTQLADGLPLVPGDRIQLQQVMLNLILNAVDAMSGSDEGSRELLIQHRGRRKRTACASRCAIGARTESGERGPALRRILHDQAGCMGMGLLDLPFDHRGAWRTRMGHDKRTPGSRLQFTPSSAGGDPRRKQASPEPIHTMAVQMTASGHQA